MFNHCSLSRKIKYFSKNGTKLDKYGANLTSEPLPQREHKSLHNQLQHIDQDMMKKGNIDSVTEAANFLINKVGQPYIGD